MTYHSLESREYNQIPLLVSFIYAYNNNNNYKELMRMFHILISEEIFNNENYITLIDVYNGARNL
jgi:hypothetical protein